MSIYTLNLKLSQEKKFYAYSWLRSKKSNNGDINSPYYIGKGHGKRAFENNRKYIPKDKQYIKLLSENMNEADAFQLEILLIYLYGRIDSGTGILKNKQSGGQGGIGQIGNFGFKNGMFGVQRFGSDNPFYGKKQTLDAIERAKKNRPDITGANNVNYGKTGPLNHNYGKKLTKEHIDKIQATKTANIMNGHIYKTPKKYIWIKNLSLGITKMIDPSDFHEYQLKGFIKGRGRTRKIICP